jgi:hypothetical protein
MTRRDYRYYAVSPRIVRADRETLITIRPLYDHVRFAEGSTYEVSLYPIAGTRRDPSGQALRRFPGQVVDGALHVRHTFEGEQEHALLIEAVAGETRKVAADLRIYSLEDDLFVCRPFKGDFHLHSFRSDGWESPGYVAASSRMIGMDFMALTDHRQYAPSQEAIEAFRNLPTDLRIYPGEEVHPPDCRVHIVNFGGCFSLNALFRASPAYAAELQAIESQLPALAPGVDRAQAAACVWCFDRIRAAAGLGIFCHPYWIAGQRYDVPEALTDWLFEAQPFDALELIGGYMRFELESNALQVARYQEERARGRQIPIVGASDSHGCERGELFGWYYSIVFAPRADLPDLIQAVKGLRSVAVEALPGELPRAHGPFRLVRYAHFLLREVFPEHDELCAPEGRLMLAYLAGDARTAEGLAACQGSVAALYARLWAQD